MNGVESEALVSVVIPTFNGERFLAATLNGVVAQTLPGVEIIVVDDGSTDATLVIAERHAPEGVRVACTNGGVSAARNRGLTLARGRYVIFLDQDDVWHPTQLARQIECFRMHPELGAVVCPYQHWWGADAEEPTWPPDPGLRVDPDFTGYVYHQFLCDCWALTSGTLLLREAVLAARGFDVSLPYGEDWDLWLRLSRETKFALLHWPPVMYRQHQAQGSRVVRNTDYRSRMLLGAARTYGLASADGRSITRKRFRAIIARYRAEHGLDHLARGSRTIGLRSLLDAWLLTPWQSKWLAIAVAGVLGWRPRSAWSGATLSEPELLSAGGGQQRSTRCQENA